MDLKELHPFCSAQQSESSHVWFYYLMCRKNCISTPAKKTAFYKDSLQRYVWNFKSWCFAFFFNLLLMVCVPITPKWALGCWGKAPIKRVQWLEIIWKWRRVSWSKSLLLRVRPVMDILYWSKEIRKRRIILTSSRLGGSQKDWKPALILL